MERDIKQWTCEDCGIDTFLTRNVDYYMVYDAIWQRHGCAFGMLHIACLEKRMGRKLVAPDDFTDCPVNRYRGYFYDR